MSRIIQIIQIRTVSDLEELPVDHKVDIGGFFRCVHISPPSEVRIQGALRGGGEGRAGDRCTLPEHRWLNASGYH